MRPVAAHGCSTVAGQSSDRAECLDQRTIRLFQRDSHTSSPRAQRNKKRDRGGQLIFHQPPVTRDGFELQLRHLAKLIATATSYKRRRELNRQFNDIADRIALAKPKRKYLLLCASTTDHDCPDPMAHLSPEAINFYQKTIPLDFEPCALHRQDGKRRLAQRVEAYGVVQHFLPRLEKHLLACRFDVKRPHPDASYLHVKISAGRRNRPLIVAITFEDDQWCAAIGRAHSRAHAKSTQRALRSGIPTRLQRVVEAWGERNPATERSAQLSLFR